MDVKGRPAAPRALTGLVAVLTSLLVAVLVGSPVAPTGASGRQPSLQERVQRTAIPVTGQLRRAPQPVGARLARGGTGKTSPHRRVSSTAAPDAALLVRAVAATTPTGAAGPSHLLAVLAPLALLLALMVSRSTRGRRAPAPISRTLGLTRPRAPPQFA